jgi:hypothetical protein
MGKKTKTEDVVVNPLILAAWKEYDGQDAFPGKVVAVRTKDDFYAVLFEEKLSDGVNYVAITFNTIMKDDELVWDVTDDGIDFDSIEQFKTMPLTKTIL